MSHLDPVLAQYTSPLRNQSVGYPATLDPTLLIEDDIAGMEEDIAAWEHTIKLNRAQIPTLEREILECERDAAIAKLKIVELRTKLAALEGGRA